MGGLLFGGIGMGAMIYGRASGMPKKIILGAMLVAASYLVTEAWLLWSCGVALTACLSMWKD